ncbi:hypothetical protein MALGJ_21020 [Mycolicibacter algericus]|uniref:Uncharacterized protein n=1 Tax=Mycolicibacter algericus TaxID=1288388 RepID=A0A7I9Y9R6_MYCAL|nr:hypothetical protein MALGJ_21020 [Mycolicibacter algericus]
MSDHPVDSTYHHCCDAIGRHSRCCLTVTNATRARNCQLEKRRGPIRSIDRSHHDHHPPRRRQCFEEAGRIIVTGVGSGIAQDPADAALVAIARLRLVVEVSPETLSVPGVTLWGMTNTNATADCNAPWSPMYRCVRGNGYDGRCAYLCGEAERPEAGAVAR